MANNSESRKSNKGTSGNSQSGHQSQMKGGQRIKESMSGSGPSGARPDQGQKESGGQHSHAGNTGFSSGQISPQAGSTGRTSMPARSRGSSGKDRNT